MVMTFGHSAARSSRWSAPWSPARSPQNRIDDAARRILVTKCEMGLLDGTCSWSIGA